MPTNYCGDYFNLLPDDLIFKIYDIIWRSCFDNVVPNISRIRFMKLRNRTILINF